MDVPLGAVDDLLSKTSSVNTPLTNPPTPLPLLPLNSHLQILNLIIHILRPLHQPRHKLTNLTPLVHSLKLLGRGGNATFKAGGNLSLRLDGDRGEKVGDVGAPGADETHFFKVGLGGCAEAVVDYAAFGEDEDFVKGVEDAVAGLVGCQDHGFAVSVGVTAEGLDKFESCLGV